MSFSVCSVLVGAHPWTDVRRVSSQADCFAQTSAFVRILNDRRNNKAAFFFSFSVSKEGWKTKTFPGSEKSLGIE